jgi:hypothetical protein
VVARNKQEWDCGEEGAQWRARNGGEKVPIAAGIGDGLRSCGRIKKVVAFEWKHLY